MAGIKDSFIGDPRDHRPPKINHNPIPGKWGAEVERAPASLSKVISALVRLQQVVMSQLKESTGGLIHRLSRREGRRGHCAWLSLDYRMIHPPTDPQRMVADSSKSMG